MSRPAETYRFGCFRVEAHEQRITRDGTAIPVTPKVFDTLMVFLRNAGRLLTKEELLQTVWPDTTVEEANLAVNVSTLRKLLAAGAQPCIETVARRGYRFVLPVSVEKASTDPAIAGPRRHRPSTARAQELYARANQAAYEADHWETARDLYQACVEEDPLFAAAWARLARCHRIIAKYTASAATRENARSQAEAAFERALALDEDLPLTHSLYAQFEVDTGRAAGASVRLLRVIQRHGVDAAAFAGLVHSLRFCGSLEASRAAHHRARALDPTVVTSVAHTYWLLGNFENALLETAGDIGYMPGLALASLGRHADAIAALQWRERDTRDNRARAFLISLRALLQGHREECVEALHRAADGLTDPEAKYYVARSFAHLRHHDVAIGMLRQVVDDGYFCYPAFMSDPWLESMRGAAAFDDVLRTASARHEAAKGEIHDAGGDAILGRPTP